MAPLSYKRSANVGTHYGAAYTNAAFVVPLVALQWWDPANLPAEAMSPIRDAAPAMVAHAAIHWIYGYLSNNGILPIPKPGEPYPRIPMNVQIFIWLFSWLCFYTPSLASATEEGRGPFRQRFLEALPLGFLATVGVYSIPYKYGFSYTAHLLTVK